MLIANLGDEMFSIEDICREIGMSRTQLYRKFRSLTDNTPNDYFRTLRLHVAKELLAGQDITVSEVAYRTGFKNISYFSRAFNREFGINPSKIHN